MTGRLGRLAPGAGFALAAGGAALVPLLNSDIALLGQLTIVLTYVVVLLGLDVAMGYAGLLTMGAGAVFGLGAYASGLLDSRDVLPAFPFTPQEPVWRMALAILAGTAIAGAIGVLVLAPALRLGRAAYAMVSLYVAAALPLLLNLSQLSGLTHPDPSLQGLQNVRELVTVGQVARPRLPQAKLDVAEQVYWILLAVAALVFLAGRRLVRSHWGRAFIAVRDDETAASAMGVGVARTKLVAIAWVAFVGALGGALWAHVGNCTGNTCSFDAGFFDIPLSILFFAALVVGGTATLAGAILGAVALGLFSVIATDLDGNVKDVIYGGLLVATVVLVPGGVAGLLRRGLGLLGRRVAPPPPEPGPPAGRAERPSLPALRAPAGPGAALAVAGVTVRFGGTLALDGVGLEAAGGRVHALIGANGSGKTTMLNVISGLVRPQAGSATLDGRPLAALSPMRRARLGLGRTFQTPRVAVRLSTLENALSGAFARYRSGWLGLYLLPWRRAREDRGLRAEAALLLGAAGLGGRAAAPAEQLTHGERRLLEVARALMARPRVLLLDEPAAGLADTEIDELAGLVLAARDAGIAVVLVEHNLGFVRRVADDATALERGRVLARGAPAAVLADPLVVEAFVGAAAA